jgi:hypothetical protein
MSKPISPSFASLVQEFFTDYMTRQRSLNPQTVASYRDSFVVAAALCRADPGQAGLCC